ncbi:MAG: DUF6382 domain-containing protein [Eubacteriales bacterium]|nr:DUF6382 domain-containing protein [Eubacteriales bacterium]
MTAEYKRSLNHNYLVLHGEKEIDTASYQVRMLIANTIPCLLPCRLQSFDGEALFYYDITSKQSVSAFYEKQKLRAEDLEMLFRGIVSAVEQTASFLLNPDQLFLEPEYLYMDAEKKQLYLCCLPGYDKDVREQFQNLTEYFLPKINHQDNRAVNLGYGIYRKAMEPEFQMEQVMEELYGGGSELLQDDSEVRQTSNVLFMQERDSMKQEAADRKQRQGKEGEAENKGEKETGNTKSTRQNGKTKEKRGRNREQKSSSLGQKQGSRELDIKKQEQNKTDWEQRSGRSQERKRTDKKTGEGREAGFSRQEEKAGMSAAQKGLSAGMLSGAAMLTGVALARGMGYFPEMNGSVLIGAMLILGIVGIFVGFTWKRWENRGSQPVMPVFQDEGGQSKGTVPFYKDTDTSENEKRGESSDEYTDSEGINARESSKSCNKILDFETRQHSDERDSAKQWENDQEAPVIVGETEELTQNSVKGAASLVSKEPGIPAVISLEEELTVIGKLPAASDVVISLPTVSRIHAKIRKQGEDYYLTDLNSRNGTSVNGTMLKGEEEYCLCDQDEIHFGEAPYLFVR